MHASACGWEQRYTIRAPRFHKLWYNTNHNNPTAKPYVKHRCFKYAPGGPDIVKTFVPDRTWASCPTIRPKAELQRPGSGHVQQPALRQIRCALSSPSMQRGFRNAHSVVLETLSCCSKWLEVGPIMYLSPLRNYYVCFFVEPQYSVEEGRQWEAAEFLQEDIPEIGASFWCLLQCFLLGISLSLLP